MSIDFYFSDLTPAAQERFLKAQGISDPKEGNFDLDLIPLFTVEDVGEEGTDGWSEAQSVCEGR